MRYALLLISAAAVAQTPEFLEPVGKIDTNRPEVAEKMPLYRRVAGDRYRSWLDNDYARRALRLFAQATKVLEQSGGAPPSRGFHIALVPGGNHASVGFRVQTEKGTEDYPRAAYILLDPEPRAFEDTLLHETGHVVMTMLRGGSELPGIEVSSIPHSTAALTDRATAFSEGWAIHLETLAAHMATDLPARQRFHREQVLFGDGPWKATEYFRHSVDLMSFSQNLARYFEVRENNFAFNPAYTGPDYLRVQLEKARDFSSLRDADQLLQSEGFYASFFFLYLMRGEARATEDAVRGRHENMLRAMAATFASTRMEPDTPWLLHFVLQYMRLFPDEKNAIIDALDDLSHGVFVDADAARLWREHYLAALKLELKQLNIDGLQAARRRRHDQVAGNPQIIFSRIGPQLPCTIPSVSIRMEPFGEAQALLFDLNTAPEGILRAISGVTDGERAAWISGRPYAGLDDFRKRTGIHACGPQP
ncbi:MAG TPA: hypothetical protein VLX58_07075 [Bryobacteraceae bacterium]|nr:hypothetical protein [Bryobacteraceae bacterium]